MNDNEVTNKDLLQTLSDLKDNHLNHIEKNTSMTKWLIAIIAVEVALILFMEVM